MNVTITNTPSGSTPSIKAENLVEKRLNEALCQKEATAASILTHKNELKKLYDKKIGNTSKESFDEIDKRIAKLEFQRNVKSMSLAQEREILKEIHKLTVTRQKMAVSLQLEQQITEKKACVSLLKDSLKDKHVEISEIKRELSSIQTAVTLGCEVEHLVDKRIDCPQEKIGKILGKNGKNIQEFMSSNRVAVKIDKNRGDILLTGTLESLESAVAKINQTIEQTEERFELSSSTHIYLTNTKILACSQFRKHHPGVTFNIYRRKDSASTYSAAASYVHVCGGQADVASFKAELLRLECVSTLFSVSSRDVGLLLGKAGKNVANLVELHQVIIDIQRTARSDQSTKSDSDLSTVVAILGPPENVETAKSVIDAMIEMNKEFEELVPLDSIVKSVFLLNNGAKVQALQDDVNKILSRNVSPKSTVFINIRDSNLVIKGKVGCLQCSMKMVYEEVQRICSFAVKINIDPFAIPVIIGKNGQGIKSLKDGTTSVFLEVNRVDSVLEIIGLHKEEVERVVQAVENLINDHQVKHLQIDFDESKRSKTFSNQFQHLARSSYMKKIKKLVFIMEDEKAKEIIVRGTNENIDMARKFLHEFFEMNYVDEIYVEEEEMLDLRQGGDKSILHQVTKNHNVKIFCDKQHNLVRVIGKKEAVFASVQSFKTFLFGNKENSVLIVKVIHTDLFGLIIGKSGKKKSELEAKYPQISIFFHQSKAEILIRGNSLQAQECQSDIVEILEQNKQRCRSQKKLTTDKIDQ